MKPSDFNEQEFRMAILLRTTMQDAWYFISTSEGLCKWFMGKSAYYYAAGEQRRHNTSAETADTFRWEWLAKDLSLAGSILESSRPELFRFTFGDAYEVAISLREQDNRIRVELRQQRLASTDEFSWINCCVCWNFFLANLKSVVEHRIDLRETAVSDEMLLNR